MSGYLSLPNLSLGFLPVSCLDVQHDFDFDSRLTNELASKSGASLPLVLYVLKDSGWSRQTNSEIISQTKYLYFSYSRNDFTDEVELRWLAQSTCDFHDHDAFWIDYACMGDQEEEQLESIVKMGDIIRRASKTIILVPPGVVCPRSSQWLNWSRRLWTLPELILSRELVIVHSGGLDLEVDARYICKMIYQWEIQDLETKLLYYYIGGHKAAPHVTRNEVVETLIEVIWRDENASESMTELMLERVYALMVLLPKQIGFMKHDHPKLAFDTLMERNNLAEVSFSYPRDIKVIPSASKALENFSVPIQFFFDRPERFYPPRIVFYIKTHGSWSTSEEEMPGQPYLAVSHRQDGRSIYIEDEARFLSLRYFEYDAYWLDSACISGSEFDSCIDVYHMADVYLRATGTLIMLPSETKDGAHEINSIWKEWGESVWSIVEALLSSNLYYRFTNGPKKHISRREVFENAYDGDEQHMVLVDIAEGRRALPDYEVWAYLINSIWKKSVTMSGKLEVSNGDAEISGVSKLQELKAERVYALMTFMPVRIFPKSQRNRARCIE